MAMPELSELEINDNSARPAETGGLKEVAAAPDGACVGDDSAARTGSSSSVLIIGAAQKLLWAKEFLTADFVS